MLWWARTRLHGITAHRAALFARMALIVLAPCLMAQHSSAAAKMDLFGVTTGLTLSEVEALVKVNGWDCLTFNEQFEVVCPIETGVLMIYLSPYLKDNPVYQVKYSLGFAKTREDMVASISKRYGVKPDGFNNGDTAIVWHLDDRIFIRLVNSSRLELLNRAILEKEVEIQQAIILRKHRGD